MMDDLLFLAHRIPYPPNKGDKIRSFHLLEYLSSRYRIHLGAFIDAPADRVYINKVSEYCESTWFGNLSPRHAKARSLVGFLKGEPLTLPYYRRPALTKWIHEVETTYAIRRILVYSSGLAQYALGSEFAAARRVIDFVDVDSDKWRQYSLSKPFPLSWVYRREARLLAKFERDVSRQFDASIFVSDKEAALFRKGQDIDSSSVFAIRNGVDGHYFSVDPARPSPFAGDAQRILFTGAMDYWANAEGAAWFVEQVLPRLKTRFPYVELYIVGMNPTPAVRQLARVPGVFVTGGVPDVRPYLQYADIVVVPLRIARGIQNKVLEAMAMGRPVVTTPQALEGISAQPGRDLLVAAGSEAFAHQIQSLLMEGGEALGRSARILIERDFTWEASLPQLMNVLEASR